MTKTRMKRHDVIVVFIDLDEALPVVVTLMGLDRPQSVAGEI
jgi:hypothetical protein